MLGFEEKRTKVFQIDSLQHMFKAGTILLRDTSLIVSEVTVTAERRQLTTAVDRKVYDVKQDIVSETGTVSDLLQNIPSVQVDVDGTVSLRGSSNVQILVNGKPSPLLAAGSADVLQQIPANSVERIEVITNPSAKYTPEGTSGLINIVMKREATVGLNGSIGANAGASGRYNVTASANFKPGRLNVFGTYSFRQEERNTWSNDNRRTLDSAGSGFTHFDQTGHAYARPFMHFANLGAEYAVDDDNSIGLSGNVRYRSYTSTDTTSYRIGDIHNLTTSDYDRRRVDYDKTPGLSGTAFVQHDFIKEDHTLRLEVNGSHMFDEEDNHYSNVYRLPAGLVTLDNRLLHEYHDRIQATLDYHLKLADESTIEAGYDGRFSRVDFPYTGNYFDAVAGTFQIDTTLTRHFMYHEDIHALYGTVQQNFGTLRMLAGLRLERAIITSDLVSGGMSFENNYWRVYPTLHAGYKINDFDELQLNYSLRVNRPGADDLNPFPEYQNPRSIRAGNPLLKPEYIHSVEFGLQMHADAFSFVPGIFYRNRYNGFTWLTSALNDSTLLTTEQNLSTDQSGGVELVLSGTLFGVANINLSGNGFYEEIDASNLGYGSKKSTFSWNSSLNCNLNIAEGTMLQVNGNYRSSRLTPQGTIEPAMVINLGFRQELFDQKISLVGTIADVFASMRRETNIDTASLVQHAVQTRDSQVWFLGLLYHFGAPPKQPKDKPMEYEDNG
jgi:outer membrane receptor protein involved in Fe transport